MRDRALSLILGILIWQMAAWSVGNEVILPMPSAVFLKIISLLSDRTFYQSLCATFFRAHLGFLISFVCGIAFAMLSFRLVLIERFLSLWVRFLQTIPQISFIILLLFWFDRETSILIVIFLMSFPLIYVQVLEGLKGIDQDYMDIIDLYHHHWWYNLKKAYLPLTSVQIEGSILAGLPLALKVTVMSEVLNQARNGIGRALSLARANIDMTSVFAWTILLVVFVSVETELIQFLFHKRKQEQQ